MPLNTTAIIFIPIASVLVVSIVAGIVWCYIKERRRREAVLARKQQHTLPLHVRSSLQEGVTQADSTPQAPNYVTGVGSGQ